MATIKVLRNGQITLPAAIRRALDLERGDLLEAELKDNLIVLRPVVTLDREQAWKRLDELINQARVYNKDKDPKEIEQAVTEAVAAVRREKRAKGRE
ncbi:MAG: AbrB/MazE/SpoVT family DNA-binding domain-containing protein [Candidatus Bipolaricaulia bacterium]